MYTNFFDVSKYSEEELVVIEKLLVFDKQAYLEKYTDVLAAGVDPLTHFISNGMYESRFPWPLENLKHKSEGMLSLFSPQIRLQDLLGFNEEFYEAQYPDVPANHFMHFVLNGMGERRMPFNFCDNMASEVVAWNIMEKFDLDCGTSLDRQLYFDVKDGIAFLQALLDEIKRKKILPKTYRNNFWLAMAIGFSARKFLGAATLCYNYFYNYFLPMPHLNNWQEGIFVTGKVSKTVDYAGNQQWIVKRLAAKTSISVPDPVFLNRPNPVAQVETHPLPVPYYCVQQDIVLIGGTSMVLAGGHDLVYDYLDVRDDERKAEFKGPNILHAVNDVCTIKYIYSDVHVSEAFSLMHDHGHNYFHWLIEVLPRYLLARKNGLACDVPILIDEKIGKLQEEVMRLILGEDAILIKVPRNCSISVGKLHSVSDLSVNTVHTLQLPQKNDILISPTAIELLREVGGSNFMQGIAKCEKLLIVRTNVEFRRLVNRGLLRSMLEKECFWSFDPGLASFEEQVRVFSNARIIITEAGAAQANIVFCRPGTVIVVLVNGYKNSNYFYLAEMAQIAQLKLVFFECLRLEGSHALGVHDDMIVNISNLKQHIYDLLATENVNKVNVISKAKVRRIK